MMTKKNGQDTARQQAADDLCAALLKLKSTAECRTFLADLCTPQELAALSERWLIARMLDRDGLSYRDISQKTGASTTTVGRVARCLQQQEPGRGYRLVLDRLRRARKEASRTG